MQDLGSKYIKTINKLLFVILLFIISYFAYFAKIDIHTANILQTVKQVQKNESANTPKNDNINLSYLGNFTVSKIVDGDTIHVLDIKNNEIVVRLLVVNTLELKSANERERCLAKIGKDYTSENLLNKQVELWGDTTQPKLDKYGRTLAYIKVVDANATTTDQFYNEKLMNSGLAKVYKASPPGLFYEKYLDLQNKAISDKVGIWNNTLCE